MSASHLLRMIGLDTESAHDRRCTSKPCLARALPVDSDSYVNAAAQSNDGSVERDIVDLSRERPEYAIFDGAGHLYFHRRPIDGRAHGIDRDGAVNLAEVVFRLPPPFARNCWTHCRP
jgi:hypothetical protein